MQMLDETTLSRTRLEGGTVSEGNEILKEGIVRVNSCVFLMGEK